jgi:hypothetical protein
VNGRFLPAMMSSGFVRLIAFLRVGAVRPAFARNMPLRHANAKA